MNYWLLCLPREDLEHCMHIGTFGLARKHIIGKVSTGDRIVCCAGKGDWKIIGLGYTTSDYYIDDTKIFLKAGYFVDRFDFAANELRKECEVDVLTIIKQLSFVKNVAHWAVFFRNGIAKMSKEDWDLISKKSEIAQTTHRVAK